MLYLALTWMGLVGLELMDKMIRSISVGEALLVALRLSHLNDKVGWSSLHIFSLYTCLQNFKLMAAGRCPYIVCLLISKTFEER